MKVAKLVYYSFMTRVVVEEDATESQIVMATQKQMTTKVINDLGENLEEIILDDECPFGIFDTDNPTIPNVCPSIKPHIIP